MDINLTQTIKYPTLNNHIFDESIIAVAEALRLGGHTPAITENSILPDRLNIIWGVGSAISHSFDELASFLTPGNCIIFNMEQLASDSRLVTPEYLRFISRFVVWDYNKHNVTHLQSGPSPAPFASEFPLAPCRELATIPPPAGNSAFDIAFYGAIVPHRVEIINRLTRAGIKVKLITHDFGQKLAERLQDCALVLNIHAYPNTGIFEAPRCLRPVSCGIPVVSERSLLPGYVDWELGGVCFTDNADLVGSIQGLLNDRIACKALQENALALAGSRSHAAICEEVLAASVGAINSL